MHTATESPRLYRFSHPVLASVCAVTTREGGVSVGPYATLNLGLHVGDTAASVVENRHRAAAAFGAELSEFVFAGALQGAETVFVDESLRGAGAFQESEAPRCDALVTNSPDVVLAVMTADCLPIVCYDTSAGVLGVIHAGWRGLGAGVIESALEQMMKQGATPASCVAGVGPAIDQDHYEVGPEVVALLRQRLKPFGEEAWLRPGVGDRSQICLTSAAVQILQNAGVGEIERSAQSTSTQAFFSDRAVRPCGRQALLARLPRP